MTTGSPMTHTPLELSKIGILTPAGLTSALGRKQTLPWVVGQLVLEFHDEVLDRLGGPACELLTGAVEQVSPMADRVGVDWVTS